MNQLTLIEKVQVLFKLLFSSPIIIGIFAFSMILMIVLFFYSKINKRIIKYVFSLIYILLIGFAVFKYGKYFLVGIDSFLTLFMANIYFPIIPVYVVMMFISFIIMIFTLNSKKKSRVIKIINTVFFTIIQMLFALFIYIVESNDIDLSSNTGLYSNEQTMTLLELGMGIFVIWIIILLVILYLKKADKIFKVKHDDSPDDFDEYINDYNVPNNIKISSLDDVNSDNIIPNMNSNNIVSNLVPETNNYFNDVDLNVGNDINIYPNSDNIEVSNFNLSDNFVSETNSDFSNVNSSLDNTQIDNSFLSKDLVSNLVPETVNYFKDINVDSNVNNDFNTNIISENIVDSNSNVFGNFNFLDVQNNVERKDEDIEIIEI